MIAKDFITEWRDRAPWVSDRQVEQDLVISRALVALFSNETISNALAFRGGTALYKLHFQPAARYSEDIDLVQTKPGGIGLVLDAIHEALDAWLGKLLGTKLRALYQRKKGRDLFDLDLALQREGVSPERILEVFARYMRDSGARVTRAIFEQNLAAKKNDAAFTADLSPLLASGQTWSFEEAYDHVWRANC